MIDGGSANIDAIKLSNGVSNITIKGFIIQNFSSPGYNTIGSGIQAWVGHTSNITIQDNSFLNLGYNGILVGNDYDSDPNEWGDHTNWTVKKNIVSNCGYIGFELTNTSNSTIEDNIIHLSTPYIGAIFSSARRNETALTIKDNIIDGTPSTLYPVIYIYAYDLDMPNPNLNSVQITGNDISTVGTPFQVYIRNIGTGTVTGVTINNNNISSLKNLTSQQINAELNWWGTAVESDIQAKISGNVDYDPWIGKTNTLNCTAANTNYNFLNGVIIKFTTLPIGGGNVTVMRENKVPVAFPPGFTNLGMWIDLTSVMANYSFNAIVIADVSSLPGFDPSTTPMYFNTISSSWMAIPGGTYSASDPLFGGRASFSFETNHFTPFSYINTPASAYDIYLSSSNSVAAGLIYPNTDWGITAYEPDDWDFTAPISFYIVPEVGSVFGASDITVQWDNTMFSYAGVENTGIYSGHFFDTLHTANQVVINASRLDNANFTILPGEYIAKLNLNFLKPGNGPVNFTSLDFRAFDGLGGQLGVYTIGNGGQVKSYLGDVASSTLTSTGDGLINFDDLGPWSVSYWSGVGGVGMANYKVKYDVGPTSTNNVYGIPAVDAKIQFEDLVIFSMSYGLSAGHVYPKIEAAPTEPVEIQLGEPIIVGNQTRIPLYVSGGVENLRAMSLTFAGQFGKLASVEKGSLLTEFTNPVMVMNKVEANNIYVDLAIFGAEETGICSEGEVLTLILEGNASIQLSSAEIRNALNAPMAVKISGRGELLPKEYALIQNYPNPFNPITTINYEIPMQSMVEINIYNALGEKVAVLVNEMKEAGRYNVEFNAAGYSSGIYIYQIKANEYVSVKKMILMK